MQNILIVEDDKNLNRGISLKLEKEGYQVYSAHSIAEAERHLVDTRIQLLICDITLPDGSGLDFGRAVREKSSIYLVYLTALDQEIDIVNGYDTGADDYITKPFSVNILVSKINALMRRIGMRNESRGQVWTNGFQISVNEMQVKKDGMPIALSRTEWLLFLILVQNAGRVVPKERLLEKVWGVDADYVDDNTVTVNISRLKSRLGTDCISNVRGLGYIWTGEVISR